MMICCWCAQDGFAGTAAPRRVRPLAGAGQDGQVRAARGKLCGQKTVIIFHSSLTILSCHYGILSFVGSGRPFKSE